MIKPQNTGMHFLIPSKVEEGLSAPADDPSYTEDESIGFTICTFTSGNVGVNSNVIYHLRYRAPDIDQLSGGMSVQYQRGSLATGNSQMDGTCAVIFTRRGDIQQDRDAGVGTSTFRSRMRIL